MNYFFGIFGNVWAQIAADCISTALAGILALHVLHADTGIQTGTDTSEVTPGSAQETIDTH